MFFGMMLVDAALAAWAAGLMQQPGAPRWVRYVLVWLGVTLLLSMGLVLGSSDIVSEKNASLLGPIGSVAAMPALIIATLAQKRSKKLKP